MCVSTKPCGQDIALYHSIYLSIYLSIYTYTYIYHHDSLTWNVWSFWGGSPNSKSHRWWCVAAKGGFCPRPRVGLYRTILRPMCVKQCHTPSMTGNRNHTTYKNADDWFMKLFYPHYTAKVEWEEVHLKSIAMHEPCRHQPVSFRFPDLTL